MHTRGCCWGYRKARAQIRWEYRHISTKPYPQTYPQDIVAGLVVTACVGMESVIDAQLPLLEFQRYRLKCRSIRSTSALMICTANEISTDRAIVHFVNADLIATGLSPLRPELAARAAARLVLGKLDRLTAAGADFAFESTLSGKSYLGRFQRWKEQGYSIEIVYLRLSSAKLALKRIAIRVRQGGHNVPRADVIRRFRRGLSNFENLYRPLADH